MARYIDLEELERRINNDIKPETLEEKALIEWCKDECIRQGYVMPTADVAPKSEVAREIFEEIEKEIDFNLSIISKLLKTKGSRSCGKTVLLSKYDLFIELKKSLAKLKEKYTEGEK